MAQYVVRHGVDTFFNYGEETVAYGTVAGSFNETLGIVQSANTSKNRNVTRIRGFSGPLVSSNASVTPRDTRAQLPGTFSGGVNISYQPYDFRFLKYVFGSETGDGTTGTPYNYPQATAATDADRLKYLKLPSFSFKTNYRFGGTSAAANKSWNLLGCKVNTYNISGSIGEPISASTDIIFAEPVGVEALGTPVAISNLDPYHFNGIDIEIPEGTPVPNIVDSFSLDIANGLVAHYGLGSELVRAITEEARDFTLNLTLNKEGTTFVNQLIGATAYSALTFLPEIRIVLTASATRITTLHLLGCVLNQNDEQGNYPNVAKESLVYYPRLVYVTERVTT